MSYTVHASMKEWVLRPTPPSPPTTPHRYFKWYYQGGLYECDETNHIIEHHGIHPTEEAVVTYLSTLR